MAREEPIWEAERSLWTGGRLAYATHMAPDCLLALSQSSLLDPAEVLDNIDRVPRWRSVAMTGRRAVGGIETLVLGYRAEAERDRESYAALCTSTWRRDGGMWKLIQHHQTPVPAGG